MKKQIFILILVLVFQLKNIDSGSYFDTGNVDTTREQPLPVPPLEEIE